MSVILEYFDTICVDAASDFEVKILRTLEKGRGVDQFPDSHNRNALYDDARKSRPLEKRYPQLQ